MISGHIQDMEKHGGVVGSKKRETLLSFILGINKKING